jgi:hypothetical protein
VLHKFPAKYVTFRRNPAIHLNSFSRSVAFSPYLAQPNAICLVAV